jgi:hypothetical protein
MTRAYRREDQYRVAERRASPQPYYEEPESAEVGQQPRIVNPYAVIALVAALLGLFPVAIVFGLIAFGYPSGRGKAAIALLLGLLEVAAVAWLVLMGHRVINKAESELNIATVTPTPTAQAAPIPAAPPAPPTAAPAPVHFAGTYIYSGVDTLKITDGSAGEENFYLSLQQPSSAGNIGNASGPLTIADNRATYQSSYGPCQLVFQFATDSVTITQNAQTPADCGFGAGVQAGGKYIRQ